MGERAGITGLILAGGAGRRMGGVDKGLQPFRGRPLISWSLERLAPQVSEILINANRNHADYVQFGCLIVADRFGNLDGPLAGFHSGLCAAAGELIVAVPCDCPFLPADLVARLQAPLRDTDIDLSYATTGARSHPVICILRRRLLPALEAFLETGGRKVDAWFSTLNAAAVSFDDEAGAFVNLNTPEELQAAESAPDAAADPERQGLREG